MKSRVLIVIPVIFTLACGDDAGTQSHPFVMDSLTLPTDPTHGEQLAFDLDGDGATDNALGDALALLGSQGDGAIGLQGLVDDSIHHGHVFMLHRVTAADLSDAAHVESEFLRGTTSVAPCADAAETQCGQHLSGEAAFQIDPTSPDARVAGVISAGWFTGGPGRANVQVALSDTSPPMTFDLLDARMEYRIGETISDGRLGGAIAHDDIEANILPGIRDLMDLALADHCAATTAPCCDEGSVGETLVELFDEDGDCRITLQELQDSPTLSAVLAPDVDLDGDGVLDAVSLGVGFTSVGAVIEP